MNTARKIVIFVGPPGSGKGSLSNLCMEHLNWVQLSTGNLCRKHIAEQTNIGQEIDAAMRAGKLISDHLIISMVNDWLREQHSTSIILDGYPRTVVQAQALKELVESELNACNLNVIRLSISDDQVVIRLGGRAVCQNKNCQAVYSSLPGSVLAPRQHMTCDRCGEHLIRRNDDEVQAIRERLLTYYKHENNLLEYYMKSGIDIKQVHVEKPLHDVFGEFKQLMGLGSL